MPPKTDSSILIKCVIAPSNPNRRKKYKKFWEINAQWTSTSSSQCQSSCCKKRWKRIRLLLSIRTKCRRLASSVLTPLIKLLTDQFLLSDHFSNIFTS
jgi:hypothetical protein